MIQTNWSKEKPYCIYKHTSPSGKVYIGQTKQRLLNKRWKNGNIYGYCNTSIFRKAIDKYGWENITHEILIDGLSKEEANEREKECIKYYKSLNISYNVSEGADGNSRTMSAETKLKISRAHLGKKRGPHSKEWNDNISKNRKGIKYSNEAIENFKKAGYKRRGRLISDSQKQILSKSSQDRIWINDGKQNKFIKSSDVQIFIDKGYQFGRLPFNTTKEKFGAGKIGKKLMISPIGQRKYFSKHEIQEMENVGWVLKNKLNIH